MHDPNESQAHSGPVISIATDPPEPALREETALCLSGGGYRAMLFHVGAIWRIHQLGVLSRISRFSSVSGGSIIAGLLGLRWNSLEFGADRESSFRRQIVEPIRELARHSIDVHAAVAILNPLKSIPESIADSYRRYLFGDSTLQDLPDEPRFVLNATNVQSKVLWRFSKPYMRDYRVGEIKQPKTSLAVAVGASSAFPPFLSPVILHFREEDFVPGSGLDLQKPEFMKRVVLTDGGVYDNLGLETAWKQYRTILVSDGGGLAADDATPHEDWPRHAYRTLEIIDNQVRSLRKRQVVDSFCKDERKGTYWGIRTDIRNYQVPSLDCPTVSALSLANLGTRLASVDERTQERLINWGYAVCDAGMRAHCPQLLSGLEGRVGEFPYPGGIV